ncbi:late embryogenesis abundant hydroxyproline-rich glycoprotein [Corchorus olitorius]|uniref:Late embryogenesis abundant hydroxyproline-rich glycoprotein n=1 Tax=Corchorus olitorius TaxID=93759 RepID=A0A1R3HT20_9ROSI|nr:late embryogenesis abundant hydroxyproline-rich glycoprotein [Corchorus olitorius]
MEQTNRSSVAIGIPSYLFTVGAHNIDVQVQAPNPAPAPALPARAAPVPVCAICCILILGVIIFSPLISYAIYYYLQTCPKFELKSLSVSDLNVSGSEITGYWNAEIKVRNRDHAFYDYGHPIVSVLYNNQLLSEVTMSQEVELKPKKTQSFAANGTITLSRRIVDENQVVVADEIARDYGSRGVVAFTVRLLRTDDTSTLNVTCADVKVGFSNNSSHGISMLLDHELQYSPNVTNRLCTIHTDMC